MGVLLKVTQTKGNGQKELEFLIKNLEGKQGQVGFFETSKYENGIPVAYVASIQEFGDPSHNIPPRPFMRPTIKRESTKWLKLLEDGFKAIARGEITLKAMLEQFILVPPADIKITISQLMEPALKKSTIAARKRRRANKKLTGSLDKPLLDTHYMFDSVQGVVVDK